MAMLKRIAGYEICLWNIEGMVLRNSPILVIQKNGFTEIVSFEYNEVKHEMGDTIIRASVRNAINNWIMDNKEKLLEEFELANSFSKDYEPIHIYKKRTTPAISMSFS